jgi:prepilin-type N-terminal cleavage/methylation domain-containing protein
MRSVPRRTGFTLIEMLVVIAIMVILAALLAAGVMMWISGQSRRNTESNYRTAQKLFMQHWSAVIDDAKKEDIGGLAALGTLASPDPGNQRARVIWIKLRLMEAFPQSFTEVVNNSPGKAGSWTWANYIPRNRQKYQPAYERLVGAALNNASHNPATEQGACLAMAISTSHAGKRTSADELGAICLDTDGDGMKEVVDGYRQPAGFVRFATDLTTPGLQATNPASGANALFADPLDATGLLLSPTWYSTKAGSNCMLYQQVAGYLISPNNGQSEYYTQPVIVSAGPDGVFGTSDDVFSFQLR